MTPLAPANPVVLRTPSLPALAMWVPNLVWQARHDWPVLALGSDIADEYGWAAWGPPARESAPVVEVGRERPARHFAGCRRGPVVDNSADADNEEGGPGPGSATHRVRRGPGSGRGCRTWTPERLIPRSAA